MPVTRNAPFSLVFSAIRKENYQYVFRGKVRKLFKPVNSGAALVTMVCQSMPSRADNEAIQVLVHARYNMTAGTSIGNSGCMYIWSRIAMLTNQCDVEPNVDRRSRLAYRHHLRGEREKLVIAANEEIESLRMKIEHPSE